MELNQLPDEYRQTFENLKQSVVAASRHGMKKQSLWQIEGFAHQYLKAISLLSRMRNNPAWQGYVSKSQRTLLDANILLYPEESMTFKQLGRYFWVILPAQLWENRGYYLLATGICGACTLLGFLIVLQNFEMAKVFMPVSLRSSHELEEYLFSTQAQAAMLHSGRGISDSEKSLFATALMINNIRVALICFTMGVVFALPTLLLLVQTGLMLGTLPALFYEGDLYGLGAWLLPHGVPEIGAILLASGAGLKLGLAMLKTSVDGMAKQFREALKNVAGTMIVSILMLIWAGVVESFIRQSHLGNETRYAIAGFSLLPIGLLFIRSFFAYQSFYKPESSNNARML